MCLKYIFERVLIKLEFLTANGNVYFYKMLNFKQIRLNISGRLL